MPTFIVRKETTITRQEGDVADVVFVVPKVLSMTGRTARFGVFNSAGTAIFEHETPDPITIASQTITVPLLPVDTTGHSGSHRWELEVNDDDGPITIGRGTFIITPQLLTAE